MKTSGLLVLGGVFLASSRGAPAALGGWEDRAREIASRRGCPPALLLATIDTENPSWNADALNYTAGDAARGGAWSLPQITWRTALAVDDQHPTSDPSWADLDPVRAPWGLTDHPEIALQLAASLIADNAQHAQGAPYSQQWLQDVAALYNSGHPYAQAPASTRDDYVPRFLRAYAARAGVA